MIPVVLPPNVIHHFYRGGTRLSALRGTTMDSAHLPEEWLAATVHRAGLPDSGPSRLADGTLFADLVAADPDGWLGTGPRPAGDTDTGILVKLLDADQRLPVHVHPDRAFARTHLHTCYGKTEAWYVLDAVGPDACVWLGWNTDVTPGDLDAAVDAQDSGWMLSRLHRIEVAPGDGILVPAGTPHAIGAGVFVVEVQEPSDQSILLEWSVTTSGRDDSHLDLGFPLAMQAVSHSAVDDAALAALQVHVDPADAGQHPLLPADADAFFRMQQLRPAASGEVAVQPAGYAVVVVVDGAGTLTGDGGTLEVARGQVLAVPAGFGSWRAEGDLRLVVCRPGTDRPQAVTR